MTNAVTRGVQAVWVVTMVACAGCSGPSPRAPERRLENLGPPALHAVESEQLRKAVSYNISEWTEEPDWAASLKGSIADFRKKSAKRKGKQAGADDDDEDYDIDAMVDEQLKPYLWWTNDVAVALGLPSDGVVYHYHPIRFIEWVNAKLQEGAGKEEVVSVTETKEIDTTVLMGDIDDVTGDSAFVDTDAPDPDDGKIGVEHLIEGYEGEAKLFGEAP